MKTILYLVSVHVEPTPLHPKFFEFGRSVLNTWIHAESEDDACGRVTKILEVLPYIDVGDGPFAVPADSIPKGNPGIDASVECAKTVGMCQLLNVPKLGTDESIPTIAPPAAPDAGV